LVLAVKTIRAFALFSVPLTTGAAQFLRLGLGDDFPRVGVNPCVDVVLISGRDGVGILSVALAGAAIAGFTPAVVEGVFEG